MEKNHWKSSKYEIFETKYKSPISSDALLDYNYTLLDTLKIKGRNSYLIHFKNKKKSKSKGLEGFLYIDMNNFAISIISLNPTVRLRWNFTKNLLIYLYISC